MFFKNKFISILGLIAFLILIYASRYYIVNVYSLLVESGFYIPKESSIWQFRSTVWNEGSGEYWIYAEDDFYLYYAGDGVGSKQYIKAIKSQNCLHLNKVDYKTWCEYK